jgi:hypothetical protein
MWEEIKGGLYHTLNRGLKAQAGGPLHGGGTFEERGHSNEPLLRREDVPGKPTKFFRWV